MNEDIEEALELAAGLRIPCGLDDGRRTASRRDVTVTRKTILLFLESLDAELTVAELRERLDQ
ncbi:hypothetical protein LAC81_07650 [Ensifer adhaerens]|uniref:hypothetical protein n=1 Tax=Ensifer adhaerens TaxID=106592 RepID=UPI001CBB209F|nr:hypothetical protein [Ensifer adhaerens]MBZ7921654.1 hypothetical protein [Ensifer adhaerens]UAX94069.1 hypothetical protein LAC78_07645 [Ensifer adhaerens]UAY01703.1 hypothetical protein LAC80_07650 [Ensifer adhaerens]UAY09087.1 hypothetical protein LAC81_07650 [Ensifer adhaerens]